MRKVSAVILTVVILLLSFATVPVMAKGNVELKLTDATVYAGDEFEIKLFISDNSQLSGAVIDLTYDSEQIEFISAEKGAIIDSSAMVSIKNFSDKSYVRFTYMAPSSSVTSDGILFSVKFKALAKAEGQSTVKISIPSAGDFVNADAEKLAYTVNNSTVKFVNTTHESVETTESTSTEIETSTTDTTISITESTINENNVNSENNDNDNMKVVIGLFTAGGIIIVGVVIYLVISKKKKG